MSNQTILLLGASGYVGSRFAEYFETHGILFQNPSRKDIDYTRRSSLGELLDKTRPGFVVNAAGYTGKPNVDAAEKEKADCLHGNAVFPGFLKEACDRRGIPWGHISSGCIFTGRRADGAGFTEEDVPNFSFRSPPCSFYSGTKAMGEEVLGYREDPDSGKWLPDRPPTGYIWRMRIPFDHMDMGRNYLSKLLRYDRLLDAENSISHLDDFVETCMATWKQQVPFGIYNVTNPGFVTTRQVVEMILDSPVGDMLARRNKRFDFFSDEVEFMAKAAITPRSNCVMDSEKLARVGLPLRPVTEAIRDALERWEPEQQAASI